MQGFILLVLHALCFKSWQLIQLLSALKDSLLLTRFLPLTPRLDIYLCILWQQQFCYPRVSFLQYESTHLAPFVTKVFRFTFCIVLSLLMSAQQVGRLLFLFQGLLDQSYIGCISLALWLTFSAGLLASTLLLVVHPSSEPQVLGALYSSLAMASRRTDLVPRPRSTLSPLSQ